MYKKMREEGGAYSRAGTCLPLWPGVGASLRVLIIEVWKAFDSAFLNYFC